MKFKFLAYMPVMAAALVSFASCSEDFLNRETDGGYKTPEQMEKAAQWNPKILLGETQGVTTSLTRWTAGGSSSQGDFGQKSIDIATDIISHDMVMSRGSNYGYFADEAEGTAIGRKGDRTSTTWYTYYRVIDACNLTFKTVGSDEDEPTNAQNRLYFAQAKTARAYAYLQLETLYAGDYQTDKDKKVLPIYRAQSDESAAPQTNAKVYEQIHFDLDGAIAAFKSANEAGAVSKTLDQPTIAVAYTLKAYAYLQTGNYAEAKTYADLAIQTSGKTILSGENLYFGFNTVNNNNWMWGLEVTADNTAALPTFWGMMDIYTYSYAAAGDFKVINSDLFNQIPETDARRAWFTESPYYNAYVGKPAAILFLLPSGKFYSDRSHEIMGDMSWESDIHFMRIEECYLIAAEAEARQGNLTSACTYLKAILDNRDEVKAAAISSMNQQQLLDEIFFEWRVEMWGEGKSLMTFKRFKKNIETTADNDYFNEQGTIPYNSDKLIFKIPNQEFQYNPNMKYADQ